MLVPHEVIQAHARLAPYVVKTPIFEYPTLNARFGCRTFFKYEGSQHTGSFKFRGALNTILKWHEEGEKIKHIVAVSSGNHAQAVAYAAKLFNYPCTVFMPKNVSPLKLKNTQSHGAEVVLCDSRQEMVDLALEREKAGAHYIPPFDLDSVIAGQGTSCLEVLQDGLKPTAIFATVSGGGWIGGTYLAAQESSPGSAVIGVEPALANDAFLSFEKGQIVSLQQPSLTIADGARVPQVANRTFEILKNLDAMMTVTEEEIVFWMKEFSKISGLVVEPTSAVAIAGAFRWMELLHSKNLKPSSDHSTESDSVVFNPRQSSKKDLQLDLPNSSILVMISGRNVEKIENIV